MGGEGQRTEEAVEEGWSWEENVSRMKSDQEPGQNLKHNYYLKILTSSRSTLWMRTPVPILLELVMLVTSLSVTMVNISVLCNHCPMGKPLAYGLRFA